jgi:hypothetical protein
VRLVVIRLGERADEAEHGRRVRLLLVLGIERGHTRSHDADRLVVTAGAPEEVGEDAVDDGEASISAARWRQMRACSAASTSSQTQAASTKRRAASPRSSAASATSAAQK